ncbi:hypothetical protein [Pseudomonas prosekii]|uniref:Zinc ribbon domain-containing protein n=1 Tax=Pseudomonas prosekii TaxID=1148509 RepID=A0A1H1S1H0_9PSED|nr:hypothetical protein [Pseudomonas prosekii]SDS41792.1 hypothetical protein SAMN05216222_1414 [Pseudomonas prosekii]
MTTTKCRKCSAFYPEKDPVCPSCSSPNRKDAEGTFAGFKSAAPVIQLALFFFVVAAIGFWFFGGHDKGSRSNNSELTEAALESSAFNLVSEKLKDPDSAKFGPTVRHVVTGNEHAVCGTVNSKNGFGGYVGMKRFAYIHERATVFFDDGTDDFVRVWDSFCT